MNVLVRSENVSSAALDETRLTRPIIEIRSLTKTYDEKAGPVIDNLSLQIQKGTIHGIIGRSGAGKSTLVRCLNGLVHPSDGKVFVSGREITALGQDELRLVRREVSMIFQHFSLLSSRTAFGNVALPLELAGADRQTIKSRVNDLLGLVGLKERAHAYPSELSGGQKQRVGIARALALEPSVLLSDEATSALDPETTEQILSLLKDINRRLGLTIVLITHEMDVVRQIADYVTVLDQGRIVESGPTFDIFAFPESPIARSFLASIVAHDLPPEVSDRLLPTPVVGSDPVLRIIFSGEAAHAPVVATLVQRFGINPNILHGRIDYIGGKPLGIMTLVAEGGPADLAAVRSYLSSLNLHGEVIGHVVRSAFAGAHRALA
ncbi:methionine ABC transporter ATP-binding protein [Brucella pseudintermedia]|uniref:methionine ABC transporter ATP-binding protein n=1 Tax=Brucella pseudintermedia TaxID=370111 RepID=UPI0015897F1D|nr:methionine ABC transporter ATP-binding protein [Brucella pseudintermedia]